MPAELSVVLFGLLAATSWGAGDFSGGLASRRASALAVVLASQLVGVAITSVGTIVRGEPLPTLADAAWAAAAGAGGGIALAAFYRGLAVGRVSTVAPIAGVLAAAVPVAVGAVLEGAPTIRQAIGIGCALGAVVLVSAASEEDRLPAGDAARRRSLVLATVAGLGFGLFYVLIDRVSPGLVFGPLVPARVASISTVALAAFVSRASFAGLRSVLPLVGAAGALDVGGNAGFLLAAQAGRLDVASILASLYPIVTVLLAIALLRERVGPRHAVGMAAAIVAIGLIGSG